MQFDGEFDAAFSNATLHWVIAKEAARAIFRALKPGGRFAGEMGGEGNLAKLREALDEELIIRGYAPPVEASNWYASPEDFARVYEAAGFERDRCPSDRTADGARAWRRRMGYHLPPGLARPRRSAGGERAEIGAAVADRFGTTSPIMSAFASS